MSGSSVAVKVGRKDEVMRMEGRIVMVLPEASDVETIGDGKEEVDRAYCSSREGGGNLAFPSSSIDCVSS